MTFPANFLWGAAAAGYQVEAAPGTADWDVFVDTPEIRDRVRRFSLAATGRPVDYVNPGPGIGHESLEVLRADLDRCRAVGMNAYRFSVEWNRVQPEPPSVPPTPDTPPSPPQFNQAAIDHYLAVIEAILARRMTPVISLNHMSLPRWVLTPPAATRNVAPFVQLPVAAEDSQWANSLRGWEGGLTPRMYGVFVRTFAQAVKARFPTARPLWLTLNEPIGSMVGVGYVGATWCPGFGGEADRGKRVCLGLVRGHVAAFDALKSVDINYEVGFAHAMLFPTATTFSSAVAGAAAGAVTGATIGGVAGAAAGAINGLLIGSYFGPIGALFGLIIGAIIGGVGGAVAGGVAGAGVGTVVAGAQNIQQVALDQFDYFINDWMLNALARGEVDVDFDVDGRRLMTAAEWARFHGYPAGTSIVPKLDFVGINYYRRVHVYWYPPASWVVPMMGGIFKNDMHGDADPHGVLNELGWEVFPTGLRSFLRRIRDRFGLPALITENGVPEALDANRAANVVAHLDEIDRALGGTNPARVMGYLHWTIVDNWEWHEGYNARARFGLFTTGDRTDPANSIAVGGTGTFRRQLTEGALALRSVIQDRAPGPARARFGTVASAGERVDPPTRSNGALWLGDLGGQPVKLFFDTTAGGPHTGLLYYRTQNLWVPLADVLWTATGRNLTFRHAAATAGIPARSADLVLSAATHALTGSLRPSGGGPPQQLNAQRTRLHGTWLPIAAAAMWRALSFHLLDDGPAVGKRLLPGDGRRWDSFRVVGTVTTPSFEVGGSSFDVVFASDPRELELVQRSGVPSPFGPVRFRRAASTFAPLGEP